MTTTEIASYRNGGYNVSLFSDGTKVREGKGIPNFPESMDIKITDQCNLHNHCKWCHEGSTPEGSHADLGKLLSVLRGLPKGVELAIGGGNPLAHPDLPEFLTSVKEMGLVPNITINELHTHQYRKQIEGIVDKVYGIGITYSGRYELGWLHHLTDNVVYHLVAGIHSPEDMKDLPKSLVLGYKQIRKGLVFYSSEVEVNLKQWRQKIRNYLGESLVSFDNLAIEQLDIKRFLTDNTWRQFYMGDDGTFTFYLDAVKEEFALSSTSMDRCSFLGSATEMFRHVRG